MANKDLFSAALAEEGVSGSLADVARSIYMQESGGGKNTRTSNAGAMGGMQIIPSTFKSVADPGWDINDPMHNARAGIRYLKQLDKQAGGDPVLTAAGYYGGPGGLEKARKGIAVSDPRNPNAPNTLQYGQQVAARMGKSAPVIDTAEVVPVQLAQVQETPLPVQQAPVQQVAPVAPVEPAWQQFQQISNAPIQVADLQQYEQPMPVFNMPQVAMPQIQRARVPNFRAFGKWKGVA